MCDLKGGETVVVFGAGPVGLFAMRSAWLLGAGRVIAVDQVDYRLDFARRWARAEALNFRQVDAITAIEAMTDDRGADASIDAVGCEAALNWCFDATRMLLLADRVDSWSLRTRRLLKLVVPAFVVVLVTRRALGMARS